MRSIHFLFRHWAAVASIPITWTLIGAGFSVDTYWVEDPFFFFGTATLLTVLVCGSVGSAVVAHENPARRRSALRLLLLLTLLTLSFATDPRMTPLVARAGAGFVVALLLRVAPRVVLLLMLLSPGTAGVLLAVGALLLPMPVKAYFREIFPPRLGGTR